MKSLLELSIVHELTHGRHGVGGDLHQVQPSLLRLVQSFLGGHKAQLLAVGGDKTDLLIPDLLIDLMRLLADKKHLSSSKRENL